MNKNPQTVTVTVV